MKNAKKLIIFDLDGTLLDTSEGILHCYHKTAKLLNLKKNPIDNDSIVIGGPLSDGFRTLYDIPDEETLAKKLEGLESQQTTMKEVNAYFRKHKTLDGCPELTPEQAEKLKADMAQSWHLDKSKPYPAYLLSNNNANIRRVRQRIEELSSRSEFAGWTFPGGEAKINEAENRLQLIFEEKPDADQRQELKSNGFKWAPSQGAWQRQLNQNAIRAAARIDFLRPEDGTSPYQLQPFVKRENKEMSR